MSDDKLMRLRCRLSPPSSSPQERTDVQNIDLMNRWILP